jgi:hypothetical protein
VHQLLIFLETDKHEDALQRWKFLRQRFPEWARSQIAREIVSRIAEPKLQKIRDLIRSDRAKEATEDWVALKQDFPDLAKDQEDFREIDAQVSR